MARPNKPATKLARGSEGRVRISIRLPVELLEAVDALARDGLRSREKQVEVMLRDGVRRGGK